MAPRSRALFFTLIAVLGVSCEATDSQGNTQLSESRLGVSALTVRGHLTNHRQVLEGLIHRSAGIRPRQTCASLAARD
jgi:hypothetical protein